MKIKITIPDFVTVEQYQQLVDIEHLSDLMKIIRYVSVLSGISEDEIKTWDHLGIKDVYSDLITAMDAKEEFHPIFEYEGQLFGFANINKLSLGQYVDLENLAKDPNKNLHEMMAILYRPIKKHNFKNLVWKKLHGWMVKRGKIDNIFKHYTLEKYDSEDRVEAAETFKNIPFNFALGALAFFLGSANGYLNHMLPSSTSEEKMVKTEMENLNLSLLAAIGAGLRQFIISPNQIFSISQKKTISLT